MAAQTPVDWCELLGKELTICTGPPSVRPGTEEKKTTGASLLASIGSGIGVQDSKKRMDGFSYVQTSIVLPPTLKLLLVYFSGRWCPTCQQFDVMMKKVYEGLKALPESSYLELVWVSCDLSEEAHRAHLKRLGVMLGAPWSPKRLQMFTERWGVNAIPGLLVLDAITGHPITSNGSEDADGFAGLFLHWSELLDQKRAAEDNGDVKADSDSEAGLSEISEP
eukprot:TRINITY_DN13610_c0_g1_i3.p1 TRINITY_DN13610_c0_g1~~TRINITY_DN13610_c0_g1_i3.p1  ORF type:complete len:222 (-),score=41.30 TRINITY_DN13610_c0_g1_i3:243-908(-)